MLSAVVTHKGGGLSFTNSWKGETKMGIGLRVSSEGGAGDGGHVSLNFNYFLRNCEYNRQAGSATDHRHLHVSFLVLFNILVFNSILACMYFSLYFCIQKLLVQLNILKCIILEEHSLGGVHWTDVVCAAMYQGGSLLD